MQQEPPPPAATPASPWETSPTAYPANAYPPGSYPAHPYPAERPRTGRGLAIASLVMSGLALLGVLGVLGVLVAGGMWFMSGADAPLTGTVPGVAADGSLAGAHLSTAVTAQLEDEWAADVSGMTCPDTPEVGQGVVTVCHGEIDWADWAVIVYFEDTAGRYTLNPI